MNLRNRLSLTVTTVTAAALLSSFLTVYVLVRRDETHDLDRALTGQAHALAQIAAVKSPDRPAVLDGVAEVPENLHPIQRYIAVYDEQGKLLSATQNFGGEVPSFHNLGATSPVPWDGTATESHGARRCAARGDRARGQPGARAALRGLQALGR